MAALNVKDALSYLDQVKVQFAEQPDVYNRFLDIMKDFKSQSIDTPGVIERVSTLFRGHPSLIQGFNTFLPPGYRIECSMDPSEANMITVTTPSGTTTQKEGAKGIAGAVRQGAAQAASSSSTSPSRRRSAGGQGSPTSSSQSQQAGSSAQPPRLPQGSLAPIQQQATGSSGSRRSPPSLQQQQGTAAQPHPAVSGLAAPAPATPGAAAGAGVLSQGSILGGGLNNHPSGLAGSQQQHPQNQSLDFQRATQQGQAQAETSPDGGAGRPPVEFNHAINYVNKIKQRFSGDPETYKQFLEILQTYQKEGRAIQDVYAQVTVLFEGAKDLLDEFKQFLPDTTSQPGGSQPAGLASIGPGAGLAPPPGSAAASASGSGMYALGQATSGMGQPGLVANVPGAQRPPVHAPSLPAAAATAAATGGPGSLDHVVANSGSTRKAGAPNAGAGQSGTGSSRGKKRGAPGEAGTAGTAGGKAAAGNQGAQSTTGGRSKKAKHGHRGPAGAQGGVQPQDRLSPTQGMPAMMPVDQAAAAYGLPPAAAQQLGAAFGGADGMVPADAAAAAAAAAAGLAPANMVSTGIPLGPAYAPLATLDEVAFFDRVKKHIDDRGAYLEFLKLLNLYTQDVIDVRTLVDKAAVFIGGHRDLFATFKSLCGYEMGRHGWLDEEEAVIENTPALERPRIDLGTCELYGASYRRLPGEEVTLACSGRDNMCWEVLNDTWVSHPTWASEGEGFNPHKKNVYEDALYRSEEERHEYDYHIEANLRTIALLEPIAARIAAMDEQERATFRLKPGLGGQSRSIYQRVLRKIYGRDAGQEIVAALHDSPSTSVPVVLARLRQKDEEWKRAQREWNKVWRVVDERNWWKSLDHRGVSWKTHDKKAITSRGLIGEIELRRAEDVGRRWMSELGAPRSILGTESAGNGKNAQAPSLPTKDSTSDTDRGPLSGPWHLEYDLSDRDLVHDIIKLALSYLDRGPAFSRGDVDRIEIFVRSFLPMLLGEDPREWEDDMGLEPVSANDDEDDGGDGSSTTGEREKNRKKDDDLRTKVLRGQVPTASNTGAPAGSADGDSEMNEGGHAELSAGDAASDSMEQTWIRADTKEALDTTKPPSEKANGPEESSTQRSSADSIPILNFFCSTSHYTYLRLFQLAYSRLGKMKRLSQELGNELDEKNARRKERGQKTSVMRGNATAMRLGLHDRWSGVGGVVGSSAATAEGKKSQTEAANDQPESTEPELPPAAVSGWELHPSKYYAALLDLIEKLFDGESVDQNMFEECVRFMFGIEGYVVFTIDKVIGGLVKMAQTIINDSKCSDLQALLQKDRVEVKRQGLGVVRAGSTAADIRAAQTSAYRHQIATRMSAECLVGKEDHLFRVGWCENKYLGFQMLSRDDPSADLPPYIGVGLGAAEGAEEKLKEERWLYYISSYALWAPTEGLHGEAKGPFLKRNLRQANAAAIKQAAQSNGASSGGSGSSPEKNAGEESSNGAAVVAAANGSAASPALSLNTPQTSPPPLPPTGSGPGSVKYVTSSGLEIKVCLSTYRLFFVSGTEDTFARAQVARRSVAEDTIKRSAVSKKVEAKRKRKFEDWLVARAKADAGQEEGDEEATAGEQKPQEEPIASEDQPQEPSNATNEQAPTSAMRDVKEDEKESSEHAGATDSMQVDESSDKKDAQGEKSADQEGETTAAAVEKAGEGEDANAKPAAGGEEEEEGQVAA
ncbi:unnamed protein product [Sympodiomycopsis kandeliae]